MATTIAPTKPAQTNQPAKAAQLRITRRSPAYWRITIDNPPINVMGPKMVREFQDVIHAIETDGDVRVVVFDSAVEGYFLNHSDFETKLEDLTSMPDGIRGDQAEAYGYVNRALPDADLEAFVEALATRIAKFDKWAIANTKRLVNTSLPPDVELGAGWDACIASLGRPAAQSGIKALMARGFHKPGDVENRLGYYLGEIPR